MSQQQAANGPTSLNLGHNAEKALNVKYENIVSGREGH
jgi:hypothetical protein